MWNLGALWELKKKIKTRSHKFAFVFWMMQKGALDKTELNQKVQFIIAHSKTSNFKTDKNGGSTWRNANVTTDGYVLQFAFN